MFLCGRLRTNGILTSRSRKLERQKGDVRHTEAQIAKAREKLGFAPRVTLAEGLAQEWEWIRDLHGR